MKDYGTDAMAASEEDVVEVAGTRQPARMRICGDRAVVANSKEGR